MQSLINMLLQVLTQLAPGATADVAAKVIEILTALIPLLIQEYKELLPLVQNVITALQQSGDITQEQWDALDALSSQYDADFRTAIDAAKAQDVAAKS
jgi:hypothetical protein